VKLLAGVGTWVGAAGALGVFVAAALVGLVLVLCQALWQRRLPNLLRNSAVLVVNLVHLNEVGMEHAVATGRSCRSVDRPLPYAVPILVGTLLVAAQLYGGA
jgi:Flp pilus assembly protein protease CpaA